ncbi:hypothetical protein [Siminovitchia sp. 179-K 8D1 HS]|uniref:hypothetical protein n=1 Tax=Siminovitchia sp. 179-K 8D1 HS TaxID=3142385 RepID=UPI0039A3D8BA
MQESQNKNQKQIKVQGIYTKMKRELCFFFMFKDNIEDPSQRELVMLKDCE